NESLMTNLKSYGFKNVEVDSAPSKEAWRGYDMWTKPLAPIQNSPESKIAQPQNDDAQMLSLSLPPNSASRSDDEASIREAVEGWANAFRSQDADRFTAYYAPKVEQFFRKKDVSHTRIHDTYQSAFGKMDSIYA